MKKIAKQEVKRKNKLLDAWMEHIFTVHEQLEKLGCEEFDDTYSDLVNVTKFSNDGLEVQLEQSKELRNISVTPKITALTSVADKMYIVMGQFKSQWWPLEIVSIASIIDKNKGEFHVAFNRYCVKQVEMPPPRSMYHS